MWQTWKQILISLIKGWCLGVISSFKCGHLKFVQRVCISYVFLTMRRITISFFYNVSHRYSQLVTYTTVSSFLVCRLIWSLIKYIELTLLSCLWPEWRQVSHSKGSHCWTVNALWEFRAFFWPCKIWYMIWNSRSLSLILFLWSLMDRWF